MKVALPAQNLCDFVLLVRSDSEPLTRSPEILPLIVAVAAAGRLALNVPPNCEFVIASAGNPHA